MENRKEFRLCKYVFDQEEKREIAEALAAAVQELAQLEDRKKAIASQIKSEIDSTQAKVNLEASKLSSGFEMRDVECEVVYAYTDDVVRWVRTDTWEVAFERKMRPDERQMKIHDAAAVTEAVMDAAENGLAESLRPKNGSGVDSVTIESRGRKVTLEAR